MIININDNYKLHVAVNPTVGNQYHIKIESQWLGAKDPQGLQRVWSAIMTKKNLLDLTETILNATK